MKLLSQLNEELKKELNSLGSANESLKSKLTSAESQAKSVENKQSYLIRDLKKSLREKEALLKKQKLELELSKKPIHSKGNPLGNSLNPNGNHKGSIQNSRTKDSLLEEKDKIISQLKADYQKLQKFSEDLEAEKKEEASNYQMEIFQLRNQLSGFVGGEFEEEEEIEGEREDYGNYEDYGEEKEVSEVVGVVKKKEGNFVGGSEKGEGEGEGNYVKENLKEKNEIIEIEQEEMSYVELEELFFDRLVISLYLHNLPNPEFRQEANSHGILFVHSLFDKFPGLLEPKLTHWFQELKKSRSEEEVVSYVCEQIHNFVLPSLDSQKGVEDLLKRTFFLYANTMEMALSEELGTRLSSASLENSFALADIPYSNSDLEIIQLKYFQKFGNFSDPTPAQILELFKGGEISTEKFEKPLGQDMDFEQDLEEVIKDYEKDSDLYEDQLHDDSPNPRVKNLQSNLPPLNHPKSLTRNPEMADNQYLTPHQKEKFRQFYSNTNIIEEHEFEKTGESQFGDNQQSKEITQENNPSTSQNKEQENLSDEFEVYEEDFD